MATTEEELGRIANALEGISLAFLGPSDAFEQVLPENVAGIIGNVGIALWDKVKIELNAILDDPAATNQGIGLGAAATMAVSPKLLNGGGRRASTLSAIGAVQAFDPRADATRKLQKVRDKVQAEIDNANCVESKLGGDDVSDAEKLKTYALFAQRTKSASNAIEASLRGVKNLLAQYRIDIETDRQFGPVANALELLDAANVDKQLKTSTENNLKDSGVTDPPISTVSSGTATKEVCPEGATDDPPLASAQACGAALSDAAGVEPASALLILPGAETSGSPERAVRVAPTPGAKTGKLKGAK